MNSGINKNCFLVTNGSLHGIVAKKGYHCYSRK